MWRSNDEPGTRSCFLQRAQTLFGENISLILHLPVETFPMVGVGAGALEELAAAAAVPPLPSVFPTVVPLSVVVAPLFPPSAVASLPPPDGFYVLTSDLVQRAIGPKPLVSTCLLVPGFCGPTTSSCVLGSIGCSGMSSNPSLALVFGGSGVFIS